MEQFDSKDARKSANEALQSTANRMIVTSLTLNSGALGLLLNSLDIASELESEKAIYADRAFFFILSIGLTFLALLLRYVNYYGLANSGSRYVKIWSINGHRIIPNLVLMLMIAVFATFILGCANVFGIWVD